MRGLWHAARSGPDRRGRGGGLTHHIGPAVALRRGVDRREGVVEEARGLLLRAIEVYESDRLDFAEAYLVACAESAGVGSIASFDKAIDRVTTVTRLEP